MKKENYKCRDCGKALSLKDNSEIVGGKVLVYDIGEAGIEKKIEVIKCDGCFEKDSSLKNYQECEVYSRVVGFYRPLKQWHVGKQQEFSERKEYICEC